MIYFVALSIIVLLVLLIQNRIKPVFLFSGLVLIYYFLELITFDKMMSGFTNSSLIILVLLIFVSFVLAKMTFIIDISNNIFSKSYNKSLLKLILSSSIFSAFLNNTAVVALMINLIKQNSYHSSSKLLIPLSYAAIFGGTMTLIGTSTNLIVNSFVIENGMKSLNIFDFFYVGAIITFLGIFVLFFISRFLPDYKKEKKSDKYFLEAMVEEESNLIGQTLVESKLLDLEHLKLAEISRDGKTISELGDDEVICACDVLLFIGDIKHIENLKKFDGLKLEHMEYDMNNIVEVIVSGESTLINRAIKNCGFRTKFESTVIAVKRGNEELSGKISDIRLKMGDNLILAVSKKFFNKENVKKNFYVLNEVGIKEKLTNNQSFFVLFSFILVLLGSFLEVFELVKGLFLLIVIFFSFKFISFDEIQRKFPVDIFLIIGSALGIAYVFMSVGISDILARYIVEILGETNVFFAFVGVYLLTLILSEIVTNNAAAALAFPIAYSTAIAYDSNLMPFIMAVAYGASASFMLPFGYQTNLMVYSVGEYSIKTFVKSGVFISLFYSTIALIFIPIFFPF